MNGMNNPSFSAKQKTPAHAQEFFICEAAFAKLA
jgi:hypothetical protein